jgi:RNA polymerase sigma-70 factor (ECF subfamily)
MADDQPQPNDPLNNAPTDATSSEKMDAASEPSQWVERHGDALFRYAMLRVRDHAVAEELVQECLLGALDARKRFGGESSERTWLIGILKHKLLDHWRRRGRDKPHEASSAELHDLAVFDERGYWKGRVQAWRDDPAELIEQREFRQVLANCLRKLPATFATCFIMKEVDGLDSSEICQVLGITATNLWARMHRARLRLRECLERNWFDS